MNAREVPSTPLSAVEVNVSRLGNRTVGIVVALIASLLTETFALAADPRDVEELRGEIRQLQGDLQAMQGAMAGMSEVEQRYAVLAKGSSGGPLAPEPAPARSVAVANADSVVENSTPRAGAASVDRPSRPSRHRRHRSSSRSRAKSGR